MVGVGGEFVQVNAHRSVVGARLAEVLELLARGENVAGSNHRERAREMIVEGRIDAVVLAAGDVDDRYVELLAFNLHQAELASDVTGARFSISLATHQQMHLEVSSETLQPRGEVDGVADDG